MTFLNSQRKKFVAVFILAAIFFFISSISTTFMGFDDSLNYHFVEGIRQGLLPYRDLNIIIAPLFHYVGVLFLCIFGATPYSFYLLGSVTLTTILLLFYNLLEKKSIDLDLKKMGLAIILIILSMLLEPNYNSFFLIFPILVIYLELKYDDSKPILTSFLTGICLGLGFLTKYPYGTYFIISYYIYLFITLFKSKFSKNKLLFVTLGGLITAFIFGLYLLFNNLYSDFANMALGSLGEFGSKNSRLYFEFLSPPIIIGMLVGASAFICYKKTKKNIYLLSGLFSMTSFLLSLPLSNNYHTSLSLIIPFFFLPFVLQELSKHLKYEKAIKTLHKIYKCTFWIIIILTLIISIKRVLKLKYFDLSEPYSKIGKVSTLTQEKADTLVEIGNYIQEKQKEGYNVYIVSADAAFYYIPLNIYTPYDAIIYGNLGYDGVNKTIEGLSKIENPLFLKLELGETVYQEPQEVEDFIVENYKLVGEIRGFRIFEK